MITHESPRTPVELRHVSTRDMTYRCEGQKSIGRLAASEFDSLDLVMIHGGSVTAQTIATRNNVERESVRKQLERLVAVGLLRDVQVLDGTVNAANVPYRYFVTPIATLMFREALSLMDRGLVAA